MRLLLLLIISMIFVNCGVKGKPLPPADLPEIGDGRPTYKGANKKLEEDDEEEQEKRESLPQ